MRTLYFILFSFIALQCNNDIELIEIDTGKNSVENLVLENHLPSNIPLNWPWRGINIESADVGKVNEQIIKELRTVGVNQIRLTIEAKKYSIRNNIPIEIGVDQHLNYCKEIVQWCANEGIAVIIESTDFPLDPLKKFSRSSPEFWDSEVELSLAISYIDKLVSLFDKFDNVVAYGFISEPLIYINGDGQRPLIWFDFFNRILNTIRNQSNKYVIFTPGPGGLPQGYLDVFEPFEDDKIIYGFHMYLPHRFTHQGIGEWTGSYGYPGLINKTYWDKDAIRKYIDPVANWAKEHNKLVYVGEFSVVRWAEGKEQYLEDVLNVFEDNQIGYSYWCLNSWIGWDMDFEPVEKDSKELIKPPYKTSTRQILENFWSKNN